MPARYFKRVNKEGSYCHLYNKGIEDKLIFKDNQDCETFIRYLKDYLSAPVDLKNNKKEFTVKGRTFRGTPHQPKNYFNKIELIAYRIEPDHFHLLLHQNTTKSIESFMRSLSTRYSIYFNKKYKRTGSLFVGPYKSVQIEEARLPLLTQYFHKDATYSSYREYLGLKTTSWIKPSFPNGILNYKDFVEKYEPSKADKEFLQGISLEGLDKHLARRFEAKVELKPKAANPRPRPRIYELLTAILIFIFLFSFGIININASPVNDIKTPEIQVLGVYTTPSPIDTPVTPSPLPTESPSSDIKAPLSASESATVITPMASASASPIATSSAAPKKTVTVKISDGSPTINIRQKPTTEAPIVSKVRNADVLEFMSIVSGWYEVKLSDNTVGFISPRYILGGTN